MNIYLTAKKIHRLAIWTTSVLGIIQGVTGLNLKYGWTFNPAVLSLHSQTGLLFVVSFLISMITGIVMYVALLPKRQVVKQGYGLKE